MNGTSSTPVLALDVDGVLNATSGTNREPVTVQIEPAWASPFTNPDVIGRTVVLNIDRDRDARFLAAVESLRVEIVWCTTWEAAANTVIGPLYGIGPRDVLAISDFGDEAQRPIKAKIAAIDAVFAGRPVLWIDDESWAVRHIWTGRDDRRQIAPAAQHGLRTADRERALRWLLKRTGNDPARARHLLREAGTPDGTPREPVMLGRPGRT